MNPAKLNIGATELRSEKFGPKALKELAAAASDSSVRKSKKASLEAMEAWNESKGITPEDFATIDGYADASLERYDELKSEWWKYFKAGESGKPILEVEAKMAREGNFLARHDRLTSEYREATARMAVQALAGTALGPAGVVAAYEAYANGPTWSGVADRNTGNLLASMKDLDAGTSPMITHNNEVKAVHRQELWKTMNTTLDKAIANGKAGHPAELDLQYYELTSPALIGKIAEAAQNGNKVRLNLDAGRLSFPSKDNEGENYFSLDATPDKLRTIIELATLPDADIAVSLFPQKKLINSSSDLMHRKIMRYGDEVLISGMNANLGSGENIDAGYLLKGAAARQLVENFSRDVQDSKGATLDDIWGSEHIQKFEETNMRLGKRGFVALFDSLGDPPSPAGAVLPSPQSLEELEMLAKKAGANLKDLVKVPAADYEKTMTKVAERRSEVELSPKGKALIRNLLAKAIQVTTSAKNIERLNDIGLPEESKVGKTRVDIADQPIERETMVIEAISKAEKFIYMPSFVITKAVAAAMVERRDQLKLEGKDLDVRVVADSGLYPHGSTPNAIGVKHLEDNGIQPRWSKLERSNWHDRKIHAKQMITDQGEIAGSTNFSNQGLTENWETSAYVHFDPSDKAAMKEQKQTKAQFEELWDTSFALSSRDHSAFLNRARGASVSEWTIEEDRERSIRHVLRLLINYEKQTGQLFEKMVETVPAVAEKRVELIAQGYSEGDSTLMAAKAHLGEERYRSLVDALPSALQLSELQQEVGDWKAEQGQGEANPGQTREAKGKSHKPAVAKFRKSDFYVGNQRASETSHTTFFA